MSIDVIAGAAAGPFAAACVVLAFAGVTKIRQPDATSAAAAALRLPAGPAAVRTLGIVEVVVAGAGLAVGGVAAGAVAVVYAALALAAWRLLLRSPGTACGCLGVSDAPISATHVVVNLAAVVVAALTIATGSPLAALGDNLWTSAAFVVLIGCCASLIASVLDTLPALNATVREGGSR